MSGAEVRLVILLAKTYGPYKLLDNSMLNT